MSQYVDLETARNSSGVRLVTVGGVPSPWSEAAKGLLRLAAVPFVAVRLMPGDKAVREWTGARNAPVVMVDGEPPRTGWAEILELVGRLAPDAAGSLVPTAPKDRVGMFGLAHELLGEGGIAWSARLLGVHAGLETQGAQGFPAPAAAYLAPRYGYAKERVAPARARIEEGWSLLREALGEREYFFNGRPGALDVYAACTVNLFALPSEDHCAMAPTFRAAFESLRREVAGPPTSIIALRDRMYARHLPLPIEV